MAHKSLGDGLRLQLTGFALGGKQWVNLSLAKGDWHRSVGVDFQPVDPAPAGRPRFLRSSLGERGSIAMRFRSAREIPGGGQCDDSAAYVGTLRGHLRFRAPQRWVEVRETKLRAIFFKERASHCRLDDRPRGALLYSCSRDGASFLASHPPNGQLGFQASSAPRERRGLYVRNRVELEGAGGAFDFSRDLEQATIRPPEPFSGESIYRERRLHSGLSFEPLHGPLVQVQDARATLVEENRNNLGYLYTCMPRSAAGSRAPAPYFSPALP